MSHHSSKFMAGYLQAATICSTYVEQFVIAAISIQFPRRGETKKKRRKMPPPRIVNPSLIRYLLTLQLGNSTYNSSFYYYPTFIESNRLKKIVLNFQHVIAFTSFFIPFAFALRIFNTCHR